MNLFKNALAAASLAAMMAPALAAGPIVLDFEGVGNNANVAEFYNGGTDSQGHSGVNYGISFGTNGLGLIDADNGGSGNFANEPSSMTALYFLAGSAVLNYSAGFDTGFSFFYTSSAAATVDVYSGVDKTGTKLATISLAANYNTNCSGDPTGQYCHWDPVGVTFNGIAKSIDFGGAANGVAFDNVTFGSATPVPGIPEPSTYAMLALGLAGVGFVARRRKTAV